MRAQFSGSMNSAYRADLDGMRAVAVVAVVLYHLEPRLVPGGFVGVDIFFVLSGFFISRQILEQIRERRFTFLGFYDRRIRRLLPALFLVLFVANIAAFFLYLPSELRRFGESQIAATFSVSNFYFWTQTSYFNPNVELQPLLHTWSLAVEEQFYLLFPPLMVALWRFLKPITVSIVVSVLCAGSFAISVWGASTHSEATFYLLPTRAWELGIGVLLALGVFGTPQHRFQRTLAAVFGLALVGFSIFFLNSSFVFPGLWAAPPCIGTALLVWAGLGGNEKDASIAYRFLSMPPLVFIGLISYSLYLWHWPIFSFTAYYTAGAIGPITKISMLTASIAVACVSWYYVENPIRRRPLLLSLTRRRIGYMSAAIVAVLTPGVVFVTLNGIDSRFDNTTLALLDAAQDYSPYREACHASGDGTQSFEETCVFGENVDTQVTVFGDSHGVEIAYALSEVAEQGAFQLRHITASGCPAALGFAASYRPNCPLHVEKMVSGLERRPPHIVVLSGFYEQWSENPHYKALFWPGYERTVARLRSAGHTVIILGDVPGHFERPLAQTLASKRYRGENVAEYSFPINTELFEQIDQRLNKIADQFGAVYIPVLSYVCQSTENCMAMRDDASIYFDSDHITVTVARQIRDDLLLPEILKSD